MTVDIEFLAGVPYFSGLGPVELDAIKPLFFEKSYRRGEAIIMEGDPPQALYLVVSGAVKILKTSPGGKEQIIAIARPGDSFNEVPLFDGKPNPASAIAMGPVTVIGLHRNSLEIILKDHSRITNNVIRVLAGKVRSLMSLVEDLSFRPVLGRIARILVQQASGGAHQLTQQEIAAMAGTAREMVGRSLKQLEDEGLIRMDHHRIVITNRQGLERMVEEG